MCAEKYNETLDFLFSALPVWERVADGAAYKPGTERVEEFARIVGNPHEKLKTIHIAGTNGKGSTASMLAAVLQSAGYRTGLYTSPHLVDFRERIRIDGAMIPPEAVVEFAGRYRDEMVRLGMTFFEMATVMGFWWFGRNAVGGAGSRPVDIAVIETGLGGRHDATNIITPRLSVITNIGLEHTRYLGGTVAAIAAEKAGIIKPGVPVVIGESDPASAPVFLAAAVRAGSPITFADTQNPETPAPLRHPEASLRGGGSLSLDLTGAYQQKNLRTVLAAIDELRRGGIDVPDAAIRAGLAHTMELTGLRGRWEVVGERPAMVVDTAHNAHGFSEIARQLARERYDKLWMVLGFAADKDVSAIAKTLPPDAHLILTQADTPRAMPVDELAKIFSLRVSPSRLGNSSKLDCCRLGVGSIFNFPFSITFSVAEAVALAVEKASPDDLVYIGGSNFVAGEFLKSCS